MMGLAILLFEQWDEIEADFQRYYRLDLRVEVAQTPLRRLNALVLGLPAESTLWRTRVAESNGREREPENRDPGRKPARVSEIVEFFSQKM